MNQTDLTSIVDRYCAAWRERDPKARAAILEAVWHEEGHYCDPMADVTGRAALSDLIAKIQAQFPDGKVVRLSPVDAHHDCFRFTWRMERTNGESLPESIDFGRIAEDGRIAEITGFFGLIGGR